MNRKFPTAWFFVIGILLGLAIIPATLYFKAQSILGEISVAEQPLSKQFFQTKIAPIPEAAIEEPPPGTKVDAPSPEAAPAEPEPFIEPVRESDRLNVLLLGIRGVDDPYGGVLTDSIMVVSFKPSNGHLALISIPRDLYVPIPFSGAQRKINEAYQIGRRFGHERDGLELAKRTVEYVTGLQIEYVVRADLTAFEKAVSALGGVDVTLSKPFVEDLQWRGQGVFSLPAGRITLNAEQANFYVRSRYTTSDFDRARRQQQVLVGLKDKALSLGVLANPSKISELLSILGDHVRTDMAVATMKGLIPTAQTMDFGHLTTKVFDNSPGGRLYSTLINRQYVLLPKGGSFAGMRDDSRSILK